MSPSLPDGSTKTDRTRLLELLTDERIAAAGAAVLEVSPVGSCGCCCCCCWFSEGERVGGDS